MDSQGGCPPPWCPCVPLTFISDLEAGGFRDPTHCRAVLRSCAIVCSLPGLELSSVHFLITRGKEGVAPSTHGYRGLIVLFSLSLLSQALTFLIFMATTITIRIAKCKVTRWSCRLVSLILLFADASVNRHLEVVILV